MAKSTVRDILACALLLTPQVAFAAVGASVESGALTITGDDAADSIVLSCVDGFTKVSGNDPGIAIACSAITSIAINSGGGPDNIDLQSMTRGAFTSAPNSTIDAGDGDDVVHGSIFNDTILGGAGNDQLHGNIGDDDIDAGTGNDFAIGNEGNDTLRLAPGSSPHHLDGGSGDDKLIYQGSGGNESIQIFWDGISIPEKHFTINADSVLTRSDEVETFVFFLDEGDDSFSGYLFDTTAIEVHGGGGTNSLSFDAKCALSTATTGSFAIDGFASASFDGFASANVVNGYMFAVQQVNAAATDTSATVALTTGAACTWTATSDSDWLTTDAAGTGSQTLTLALTANTAAEARVGHITVNGASVTIAQDGTAEKAPTPPANNDNTPTPPQGSTTGGGGTTGTTTGSGAEPPTTPEKKGCSAGGEGLIPALFAVATLIARRRVTR